ncbi:MAG: iron ABC transporter permease [Thermomicrobiales bacterium]|nr:iron ABC transporter permease [Thermomicrobiales bacterium]
MDGPRWPARAAGVRQPPLVLVALALAVAALVLLPLIYLIIRASEAGEKFRTLLLRDRTLEILINTILLSVSVAITAAVIAVPAAWLVARTDMPGGRWLSPLFALPLVIPSYIGALTFIVILGPRGELSRWLEKSAGIEAFPSIYGFWGSWLALSLFTAPYVFLTVSAALQGIDPVHEEAARSLGKGSIESFMRTTLRQLRPAIFSGMLLSALYAVSDFGVVSLMRYDSLTRAIFVQYQASFDRSYAALLGLVLVAFALLLVGAESMLRDKAVYYRIGSGVARQRQPRQLGWKKAPALLFAGVVLLLSLALPLIVLVRWLVRALRRGESFDQLLTVTGNTLVLGIAAALITTAAALPVALLAGRYRSRIGAVIERTTYIGYGLPGIVIGLSFVFLGANYLIQLYQTVPLLLLAYMVRFIPQAVGSTKSSLMQVNPRMEDASRGLGRSWTATMARITMPIAMPGVLAGAALVFLTVVKELPMTILLRPTGMDTLATEVWTASSDLRYGEASGPALMLILVSAIPSAVIFARARQTAMRGDA